MLRARTTPYGKHLVLLGLSETEMRQLRKGEPILIRGRQARESGLDDATVVICYGETEEDMRRELERLEPLLPPGVVASIRFDTVRYQLNPTTKETSMAGAVLDRMKSKGEWLGEKTDKLDRAQTLDRYMIEAAQEARALGTLIMRKAEEGAPGFGEEEIKPIADRFDTMLNKLGEGCAATKDIH